MADPVGLIRPAPAKVEDEYDVDKNDPVIARIMNLTAEKFGKVFESSAEPGTYVDDDDVAADARAVQEHYEAQSSAESGTHEADIVSPSPPEEGLDYVRNFANFMFGDTAAAVGVKWTQEGFTHNRKTMTDMWSDHPYRAALAVVADGAPLFAAATRVARMVRGAGAAIDTEHLVAKGLAESVEAYDKMEPTAKAIVQGQAKKIGEMAALRSAVDSGVATNFQKAKLMVHESFGNSYLESQTLNHTDPAAAVKEWHEKTKALITGKNVNNLLDLADDVDPLEGTAILHALKDPSKLSDLTPKARELALHYSTEGRQLQADALSEGFIDQETVDKVGDIWFSTLRQDSPIFEERAATGTLSMLRKKAGDTGDAGDLRMVNIPRTSSPNLKQRGLDQEGVTNLIKRQRANEALDAGNQSKALGLLKGTPEEAEVTGLLAGGRLAEAKKVLGKEGFIASTPKDLIVKGHIQQKLLFENFRTLRDVALNPAITKTKEEVAAMSKATRRRMVSLDRAQNAGTLRRMVAIKSGKQNVSELGFIDQSLFDEVARVSDPDSVNAYMGLLEFATALHKTAKTAMNPFTHVQNAGGNGIFLWMAGMNPDDQFRVGRQAWKSLGAFQDARKGGTSVGNIKDLGKLKSNIKGAPDIDIADELINPLLSGQHGLLDMSSMEAAEGIPIMNRLYEQAGDHQVLLKGMINLVRKGSKKSFLGMSAEKASEMYMAEDSAAKLTYYLHLRQKGMNPLSAANEVAKRLPMYGTVGHTIAGGRKAAVPWISFSTETTRIMKNNFFDRPLSTSMVMNSPEFLQAGLAMGPQAFGGTGMSYEEVQERREQNPMWAQKASGIVVPPSITDPLSNAANKGKVRTFLMDVLPHFSTSPNTEAAEGTWQEKLPYGVGNPFPIIQGFADALTGKGSFGQDIPTDPNHPSQIMKNIILKTGGMLMPPLVEKYLMNPELPATYYRGLQDLGLADNPSTGSTGDPIYDFILNNALVKSYQGGPKLKVSNQRYSDRRMSDYRGRLGRELRAWTSSSDFGTSQETDSRVIDTIRKVKSTFEREFSDNLPLATRKYKDWLKSHSRELMKHPAFKGLSKQDFISKLAQGAEQESAAINPAIEEYRNTLREGIRASRGKKKRSGGGGEDMWGVKDND